MSDRSNAVATSLGTVGTVFWCIQLLPQIIRNWWVKDATGVPPTMMLLWAVSGVPFGAYFVIQSATLPLQIQPQLFMFFCFIAVWQVFYYPPVRMNKVKLAVLMTVLVALCGGLEVALALPLRGQYNKGTTWPNLIIGIIASILLAVGLIPPYWELWKRQGRVVGINFVFLGMDSLGAVFSLLSVIMQNGKLDILGLVLYCIVLFLEIGIMTSHLVWKLRTKFGSLETPTEAAEEPKAPNTDAPFSIKSIALSSSNREVAPEKHIT